MDNSTALFQNNNSVIECRGCESKTDISEFSDLDLLNKCLDIDISDNHNFHSLQLKNYDLVSFMPDTTFEKFFFKDDESANEFLELMKKNVVGRFDINNLDIVYSKQITDLYSTRFDSENYSVVYHKRKVFFYCADCTYWCDNCSENLLNYSTRLITDSGDNICNSCYEESFFTCGFCDNIFNRNQACWVEDRDFDSCNVCANDNTSWCEYHENYEYNMCDYNYPEDESSEDDDWNGIFPYSFKPRPDFYLGSADSDNQKMFFGFELEVESMGNPMMSGINAVKDSLGDFVYLKGDGSLDRGFEIVSYPFSFNYYQEILDFGFMNKLKDLGYRSWNSETCGLHIHISKAGFVSAGHIWKFTNLILQNQRYWEKLAGRSNSRWASFGEELNQTMKILKGEYHPQKYVAVNMCNRDTIEVRIFKGSLNQTRVRSAIESLHCAIEYTKNLSVYEINQGGLKFDRFLNYLESMGFFANGEFSSFKTLLEKYGFVSVPAMPESEI